MPIIFLFYGRSVFMRVIIPLLFFPIVAHTQSFTQSLNTGWHFSESGKNQWHNATVPGTIHTDLVANHLIPDPYYGANADSVQWIETKQWEYQCSFDCDKEIWKQKNIELDFEGLDTYAFVYLNDSLLFTGEDMFLSYSKGVKKLLKKKHNRLKIVFHPIEELIKRNKKLAGIPNLPGGDRVYVRKAQYQFGWDWGPRLVTCGIWKHVKLIGYSDVFIRDLTFTTGMLDLDQHIAAVTYTAILEVHSNKTIKVDIRWGDSVICSFGIQPTEVKNGRAIVQGNITLSNPHLWWCNGMGDPFLYNFTCRASVGNKYSEKSTMFGIRSIQLITRDENGKSCFKFSLNGKDVFVKGANWIPCDNFITRVSNAKYRSLIGEVHYSNMNMLRVWGGGIYEQDEFYHDCDSLGIMVWQDFMFACGMYPGNLKFQNLVREEVSDNLWRLASHPCLAIFCGNNENDEGWQNWDWKKDFDAAQQRDIENDYQQLFASVLADVIHSSVLGAEISYIPTSPMTGWGHPEAYRMGDVHYWGVWWGKEPFSAYDAHVGRFMTEYGFQSFPARSSISEFTRYSSDEYNTLKLLMTHQKDPSGMNKLDAYLAMNFNRKMLNITEYAYLTQVMQRDAMKRAIEAHRRNEPYCMGTMFWQFNDCWPAISWSTIDWYGQKKLFQYAVKDLYAPQILSIIERHDSVLVYAVNDSDDSLLCRVDGAWYRLDSAGGYIGFSAGRKFAPHTSNFVHSFRRNQVLNDHDSSNVFLHMMIIDVKKMDTVATDNFFFCEDKDLLLTKDFNLNIKVDTKQNPDGSYNVRLWSDNFIKNLALTLDDPKAEFSDNGFDLLQQTSVTIRIKSKYSAAELQSKLHCISINKTW